CRRLQRLAGADPGDGGDPCRPRQRQHAGAGRLYAADSEGAEFRNAMQTLGGIRGILAMVGGAFNPVTLGLGALTAAGVLAWSMFREGEDAARRLEGAMLSLGDVAKNLRLSHLDEQADYVDNFARQVEEVQGASEAYYNSEVMLSNARSEEHTSE